LRLDFRRPQKIDGDLKKDHSLQFLERANAKRLSDALNELLAAEEAARVPALLEGVRKIVGAEGGAGSGLLERFEATAKEKGPAMAYAELGDAYWKGTGVPKSPEKSAKFFLLAAEEGDLRSQYFTGLHFQSGWGVGADPAKARGWFEKAARRGETRARFELGSMLLKGQGGPRDLQAGVDWLQKAADAGHEKAAELLASSREEVEGAKRRVLLQEKMKALRSRRK
jgi:TPR repeat protein